MKRLAILASIAASGLTAAGLSAQDQPPLPEIEQVSERVWKIYGAGGNTTVFVRGDGVALIDTKLPANGQAILEQVRKVTDKPVTMIVNTHSHGDHIGSNAEIDVRDTIEIVAQARTAARMAARPVPQRVSRSFDERLTLGTGADRIELYWFGAGHTDGDAFVVIPAERTMASGDIFQLMAMPRIDRSAGGSALALPDTLTRAITDIAGVDKVVDGHGDRVRSWADFGAYAAFTRALASAAGETHRQGGTPEQALAMLERDSALASFLADTGEDNSPRTRALNALNAAFEELRETAGG